MKADDLLNVYTLEDISEPGKMPVQKLVFLKQEFYEERTIGVTRYYAAMGANSRVDALVRIWEDRNITPGYYVILPDGKQYRVDFVQHLKGDDGLPVSDLTLIRLENNYDVIDGQT